MAFDKDDASSTQQQAGDSEYAVSSTEVSDGLSFDMVKLIHSHHPIRSEITFGGVLLKVHVRFEDGGQVLDNAIAKCWGAFRSPASLLIRVSLRLLRLHLQTNAMNLLGLDAEALEQLFSRLLVATETTEASAIRMLLAAVDAESHVAPSS